MNPKRALLLIDFFNPQGFAESKALLAAALRAARRVAWLRTRLPHVPIIYANDNFGCWSSDFASLVDACASARGASGEIAALLRPKRGDWVAFKPRHSAFYGTPVEFMLDELGVRSLILAGTAADACVTMTAHDAHLRKFALWVPRDCVAAKTPAIARDALVALKRVTDASIETALKAVGRAL